LLFSEDCMTHPPAPPESVQLRPGEVAIPAGAVRQGDLVLGVVADTGGAWTAIYHSDPYEAAPRPDTPHCGCPGHATIPDEERDLDHVVLYDGPLWHGACDVVPVTVLVVVRADR
jgi:hypothetical protein